MDKTPDSNRDHEDTDHGIPNDEFSTLPGDGTVDGSEDDFADEDFAGTMQLPDSGPDESTEPAETVELHSYDGPSDGDSGFILGTPQSDVEATESDLDDVGGATFVGADDLDPEPEATLAGAPEADEPDSGDHQLSDHELGEPAGTLFDKQADEEPEATLAGASDDAGAEPEATLAHADTGAIEDSHSGGSSSEVDYEATIMGSGIEPADQDDDSFDTAQMTYVPDFSDEDDDLMKTQRVDPLIVEKIASGEGFSDDDLEATAKTFAPSKTPTEATLAASMASDWQGKSQWDLRIHKCDVRGTLSGIPNAVPSRLEDAIGLQTAFVDDKMVSDFEIVSELGAGNMGVVYRARQTSLNRELAIKTLKPRKGSGSKSTLDTQHRDYEQEMFVSEAVVTANLVHPNIVPIHDLARTADGKLFYAMKQVTGTPWNKTIRKPGSLEDKLDILMKVCDAVGYAHSKGVINRDLKPENVVVGEYGEVMVLDWGLAITTERFTKRGSVLTDVRGGAGTPVYMPPEQFDRDTRRVGYHSDIYLLGAMLFEILEGFPPHYLRKLWKLDKGTNKFNAIIMAVVNNEIETDVTECELMNIARKAMATNPSERYQTVEEFQTAIREYRITGRAEELLADVEATQPTDYSKHQAAVALFDEAHAKWPENDRASEGGRRARLAYASLAVNKSDLDLASQVIDGHEGVEFDTLRSRINAARRRQMLQKVALAVFFFATVGFGAFSYVTKQDLIAKDKRLQNVDAEIAAAETQREDALKSAAAAMDEAKKAEAEALAAQNSAKIAMAEADKAKMDADIAEANAKKAAQAATVALAEAKNANDEAAKAKQETMVATAEARKSQMEAAKALDESKVAQAAAAKAKMELATAEQAVKKATVAAMAAEKEATVAKAEAVKVKKDAEVAVAKLAAESKQLTEQIAVSKKEQAELQSEVYKSEYLVHKRYIDAFTELGEYGSAVRQIDEALADKQNVEIQKRAANLRRWQDELRRREGSREVTLDQPLQGGAIGPDGSVATYSVDGSGNPQLTILNGDRELTLPGVADDLIAFAFSPDGRSLAAIGESSQQLWTLEEDGWQLSSLNYPDSVKPANWLKPLFTADGNHLLLVGGDQAGTIDAFALKDSTAKFQNRMVLAGTTDADYSLHDLAIAPDGTFLIASTTRQSCRCFPLEWIDGKPTLTKAGPNAAAIRLPIRPQIVRLSPDGQFLALSEGRDLLLLPKATTVGPRNFPFVSPKAANATTIESRIAISDLAFASDSQRLAAALSEKFVQVWDRSGDAFIRSDIPGLYKGLFLAGHSGGVNSVAFESGDDDEIISVGSDNSVRHWKLSEYAGYVDHFKELPELLSSTPEQAVSDIAPIEDALFVSLEEDSGESITGEDPVKKKEFRFRQGRITYSSRFSDDGERVIVAADDRAAHVFNSKTGERTLSANSSNSNGREGRVSLFFDPHRNAFLEGHIPQLSSVQFLPPNGDLLLTEDYFGSISVWDASKDESGIGFEVSRLLSEYSLSEFAFSPDGRLVIAGGAVIEPSDVEGETRLRHFGLVWRIEDIRSSPTPKPFLRLEGEHPRDAITAVAISPDGSRAMTAGRRGRIILWNLDDGKVLARVPSSHSKDQVSAAAFLDNDSLLTTGYDGRIFRWTREGDALTSTEWPASKEQQSKPDFIIRMRQKPDRSGFVTSAVHSERVPNTKQSQQYLIVTAWTENSSSVLLRQRLPEADQSKAFRHDLAWSSDGKQFLFVEDGRYILFDTQTWEAKRAFEDGRLDATRAAFAPDAAGQSDRIASFDGEVTHLWDLDTGDHLAEFRSHAKVFAADFSSDRRFVATASDSIRVFHSDESSPLHGQTVMRLRKEAGSPVSDVSFTPTPQSYQLASIDDVGQLSLWDWEPGGPVPAEPVASELPVADGSADTLARNAVRWHPSGELLAAIHDGRLHLWRFDGQSITAVPTQTAANLTCNAVAWSGDGSTLVAGGFGRVGSLRESVSLGQIWNVSRDGTGNWSAKQAGTFSGGHNVSTQSSSTRNGITAIAVDGTGDILTGGNRGEVIRWGVFQEPDGTATAETFGHLTLTDGSRPHEGAVLSLDRASDGGITSAGDEGWVVIWPPR